MVFFTCNACGESLKKNQVEKHYLHKCRNCEILTCVDCHKDFAGDEYQSHTKCITEDQKYSAKGWQPKASANKGERKQQAWIENIQYILQNEDEKKKLSSEVQKVLDTIIHHENIPRKKQKFTNFVKNIMRGIRPATIDETWDLFEAALKPKVNDAAKEEKKDDPDHQQENAQERNGMKMFAGMSSIKNKETEELVAATRTDKVGKKNRKKGNPNQENKCHEIEPESGLRKKQKKSKEGESKIPDNVLAENRKGKKRKRVEETETPENTKKKKKSLQGQMEENGRLNNTLKDDDEVEKSKFSWEETIEKILTKKGPLKLSKLKKKVLSEYMQSSSKPVTKSHEELGAKLEKKLTKNKKIKFLKDTVQLIH